MELKSCPFCGGEAKLTTYKNVHGTVLSSMVECKKCGAVTKRVAVSNLYGSDAEAARLWNQRAKAVREEDNNGDQTESE